MKHIVLDNDVFMHEVIQHLNMGQIVEMKVKGHSMLPFYKNNQTVVNLIKKDDYHVDDVILFKYHNQYLLHRIIKIRNEKYYIKGDGSYRLEVITKDQIYGYVSDFKTNNKEINHYKFKLKLWLFFSPFKWLLLKFVRK